MEVVTIGIGGVRSCAAETEGRKRLFANGNGNEIVGVPARGKCVELPLIVGSEGRPEPLDCDFESEAWVPELPLRFRFLYSAIASASRSSTLLATGDRTEAGFIDGGGGPNEDEPEPDRVEGRGDILVKELEWLKDGEV